MINYSFIIPHKNLPDLLRRCVSSIPRREDIEIIIVDDASDPEVVNECTMADVIEQPCVRMIFTKEDGGLSYVRNVGIKNAVGKWTFIADADDFLMPGALEMLDKYKDSEADVVCFHICAKDCYTLEPCNRCWYLNKHMDRATAGEISMNMLLINVVTTWTKLVKRDFYIRHDIRFQEDTRIWTDLYWTKLLALKAQKIEVSPDVLYCVTERSTNMSHTYISREYMKQMYYVVKTSNRLVVDNGKKEFVSNIDFFFNKIRNLSLLMYWKYYFLALIDGTFCLTTIKYSFRQRLRYLLLFTRWLCPRRSDFRHYTKK